MKINHFLLLTAVLCFSLFLSCTSTIEPPPMQSCSTDDECPSSSSNIAVVGGTFTDTRDSRDYKWVKIGEQMWMAENLKYAAEGSKCYGNNETNCATYGRLYDWATVMALPSSCNSSSCSSLMWGICPLGWHIPSDTEWSDLIQYVKLSKLLKATNGWKSGGNGTDSYGFAAIPGGNGNIGGDFDHIGECSFWWSSSERHAYGAYYLDIYYDGEKANLDFNDKSYLFSVRCIKD